MQKTNIKGNLEEGSIILDVYSQKLRETHEDGKLNNRNSQVMIQSLLSLHMAIGDEEVKDFW